MAKNFVNFSVRKYVPLPHAYVAAEVTDEFVIVEDNDGSNSRHRLPWKTIIMMEPADDNPPWPTLVPSMSAEAIPGAARGRREHETALPLAPGDIVRLKCGGPKMVVGAVNETTITFGGPKANCHWIDSSGRPNDVDFFVAALERVER